MEIQYAFMGIGKIDVLNAKAVEFVSMNVLNLNVKIVVAKHIVNMEN